MPLSLRGWKGLHGDGGHVENHVGVENPKTPAAVYDCVSEEDVW